MDGLLTREFGDGILERTRHTQADLEEPIDRAVGEQWTATADQRQVVAQVGRGLARSIGSKW